jgi:hypothetical protein
VSFRKGLEIIDYRYPKPTNKNIFLDDILEQEKVSVKKLSFHNLPSNLKTTDQNYKVKKMSLVMKSLQMMELQTQLFVMEWVKNFGRYHKGWAFCCKSSHLLRRAVGFPLQSLTQTRNFKKQGVASKNLFLFLQH